MRKIGKLAAVLAMVVSGVLVAPTAPASAKEVSIQSYGDCRAGYWCGWANADAGNPMVVSMPANAWGIIYLNQLSDQLTSYWHRGSVEGVIGDWNAARGCHEVILRVGPGGWGNVPAAANDRADIIQVGTGSGGNWCGI
jgi:hypothetical protein